MTPARIKHLAALCANLYFTTSITTPAQMAEAIEAAIRGAMDEVATEAADCVPTNWCDPLLTGPKAVSQGDWNGRHIEALLRGIQDRIRNLRKDWAR